jgi:predicted transcriptional regulator
MANLKELTATVVAAYLENAKVAADELPTLINDVYAALGGIDQPAAAPAPEPQKKATSAELRRSVTPDAIISFIDGKPYRTLKRHLTGHGLTPQTYRETYGLPSDYPMVAPSYSATRSALAKKLGLGRVAAATSVTAPAKAPARKGRPAKAIDPKTDDFT